MSSRSIEAFEPTLNRNVRIEPRANLRGGFANAGSPNVTFGVIDSNTGALLGTFEVSPGAAHTLSETIRQEAELASVAQEENTTL